MGQGIWTPKDRTPSSSRTNINEISGSTQSLAKQTPPPSPAQTTNAIWTPQPSPTTARKEFRPLHFESPTLTRRYIVQPEAPITLPQPPWTQAAATHNHNDSQYGNFTLSTPLQSTKLPTRLETPNGIISSSTCDEMASSTECVAPTASVSERIRTFERSASASELQRPVARRRPKDIPVIYRAKDVIYNVKQEYVSEPETEAARPKKMAQLERRQYDGIGPVTSDGMPIILRSEVKEPHHHEWYKRLYQTIHKQKNGGKANGS